MLGRIGDIREIINTERKFGANSTYFLTRLQLEDGSEVNAMFTHHELNTAIERAKANTEDLEKEGFLDKIRDLID